MDVFTASPEANYRAALASKLITTSYEYGLKFLDSSI